MAELGISEFTFGYAFLYEQTQANWGNLKAAPILPSLQQEELEGWDARLPLTGTDYYYQFKLSEYLSRGNAKYIRDGTYAEAYYRFWLYRRNNNQQHRRLRQHCVINPHTYYTAPQFNSIEEFNTRFLAHEINANSRIIPLSMCNDITDAEQHCITFQAGSPVWTMHSEPRKYEKSYTGRELGSLYRESDSQWNTIDIRFTEELLEKTRDLAKRVVAEEEPERALLVRPLLEEAAEGHGMRALLLRTADILSAVLGVTLVLVGSRE